MDDPVKPKRRYDSSRRRAAADATRLEILEAARRLFLTQGYAATTMQAIADEAKVAFKTIYLVFATKGGVLSALWDLALREAPDAPPVRDLPWWREMMEEPDPAKQLRLNARNSRRGKERVAAIAETIRGAAAADPEMATLWGRIQTSFHDNQRRVVISLNEKKALKPGLSVERAADILWTLNHPSVWQLMVGERGWSGDEYEQWFGDISIAQLLGEGAEGGGRRKR
jgi:AcrR family transcriptional regulator